ncbi:heavy metal-associated isoprenylated plant protein 47-like [Zingiber officinale]|uniref:heavy metal-associated isoprenylated plant protein 47-like n=1 Tax=Zingiber officinale TaxID=94328 RepID=UPI001C4D59DC|nr:heavy metal-associated isoprenylated plant protein 47-like [Zingiber officinale]
MIQQKMVLRLSMADDKRRAKALRTAVSMRGVVSVKLEGDKIVVVGDGVDSVNLTKLMRKKICSYVELLSVAEEKKEEKEEKKEEKVVMSWPNHVSFVPQYVYSIPEEPGFGGPGCIIL